MNLEAYVEQLSGLIEQACCDPGLAAHEKLWLMSWLESFARLRGVELEMPP